MAQYLLKFNKKSNGTILLTYNEEHILQEVKIDLTPSEAVLYFLRHIPAISTELDKFKPFCRITKLARDLSFKSFWDTFANKVGNKARAEKLWAQLSDNKRAKAIDYIPLYDQFLIGHPGMQKLYPETYLNQKRYDNE